MVRRDSVPSSSRTSSLKYLPPDRERWASNSCWDFVRPEVFSAHFKGWHIDRYLAIVSKYHQLQASPAGPTEKTITRQAA